MPAEGVLARLCSITKISNESTMAYATLIILIRLRLDLTAGLVYVGNGGVKFTLLLNPRGDE